MTIMRRMTFQKRHSSRELLFKRNLYLKKEADKEAGILETNSNIFTKVQKRTKLNNLRRRR